MTKTYIHNAKLVLENGVIHNGALLICNGVIEAYGEKSKVALPGDSIVIDAKDCYVGPGLVDIHNHGGGGYWFYENPSEAANYFLRNGTTSVLATFFYTMTLQEVLKGLKEIRALMSVKSSIIKGVNFEGPYLNSNYGCARDRVWHIRREEYEQIIKEGDGVIKIWCVSPELEGILDFVKAASAINVVFSAAHSDATAEQLYSLIPYGLKLATHHMNATGITGGYGFGVRNFGLGDAVQLHDDIFIELIADRNAVHVCPHFLQLAYKIKGPSRTALITDSSEFGQKKDDLRYDNNDELAGSALTMPQAMKNMMKHTGTGICEAFQMAATTPARIIGLDNELGRIEIGLAADLVILDRDMNVQSVLQKGELQEVV